MSGFSGIRGLLCICSSFFQSHEQRSLLGCVNSYFNAESIHPYLITQCLEYGEALSPAPADEEPVLRLQEGDHPRVALHRRLLPRQAQALLSSKQRC